MIRALLRPVVRPLKRRLRQTKKTLIHWIGPLFNWDLPMETEDRFWLEQRAFPYFQARPEYRRVLFVGVAYYTKHYGRFFTDQEFWTIEPDREQRRFGSQRHITDVVQHLPLYVPDDFFDLIVLNGVIGWGLNDPDDIEEAYAACHRSLRSGGILLVGWCDQPHLRCLPPKESQSLKAFEPYAFPPFGGAELLTDTHNRHTFNVFVRP